MNVRVDSSRIAHVVDPATEESLDGSAKVEGDHASGDCSHTSSLRTRGRGLVRALAVVVAAAAPIGAGSRYYSSVGTGARGHGIAKEVRERCRLMGEQALL